MTAREHFLELVEMSKAEEDELLTIEGVKKDEGVKDEVMGWQDVRGRGRSRRTCWSLLIRTRKRI